MLQISPEMDALYNELVPPYGAAETRAGEIIRAFNKLGYRFLNDGDHVGIHYGNETCNAAARFLFERVPAARDVIREMWGENSDEAYSDCLQELQDIVVQYVTEDPEEIMSEPNDEDFLDFRTDADEHDFVYFDGSWEDEEDEWDEGEDW